MGNLCAKEKVGPVMEENRREMEEARRREMEEARREMDKQNQRMAKVRGEMEERFAKCQVLVKNKVEEMARNTLRLMEIEESKEVLIDSGKTAPNKDEIENMKKNVNGMKEKIKEIETFEAEVYKNLKTLLESLCLKDEAGESEGTRKGKDGKSSDRTMQKKDEEVEEILEKDAYKEMKKAYQGLSSQLKMCLLCFSIFPVDKMIEKKVLIYWWIGEGFVTETEEKSAEAVGEEYFKKLIDLKFILPVYNRRRGNILRCRMHPYIRWLIITLARDEGFFSLYETGTPSLEPSKQRRACLFTTNEQGRLEVHYPSKSSKESTRPESSPSSEESLHSHKESTHPSPPPSSEESLHSHKESAHPSSPPSSEESLHSHKNSTHPPSLQSSTLLQTFFNVNVKCLKMKLGKNSLPKFEGLHVLQLGRWVGSHNDRMDVKDKDPKTNDNLRQHIEMEDPEILDDLVGIEELRYLSLRGMSRISGLPKWIGACQHLQILDLKGCQNLDKLTEDIKSLESLTHLDVSECYMLDHMPKSLSSLSQLTVLKGFVFGAPPSSSRPCKISELSNLTKLRKLSISISNLEKKSRDLTDLKQIKSLQILVITWSGNELDLALPPDLVKLDLRCFPGELLGKWLQPKYQGKLEKLYIRGGEKLRHLGLEEYGQIKTLRLKYLKSLEMETNEIEELRKHMNYLEIYECPGIRLSYPFDLEGVWVNDDALAPTATSGPCPAPEAAPPANAEPPAAAPSSQLSDPPATQQALPASASTSTPPGSTSTSVPTTTPPPATQTPSAPSPPPTAGP